MSRRLASAVVVILVLFVAACNGNGNNKTDIPTINENTDTSVQRVR